MKEKEIDKTLLDWKDKYQIARSAYSEKLSEFEKYQKQYEGKLQPEKGKETTTLYNFTLELIESVIDSGIPAPKVEAVVPTDRNKKLAMIIESMCREEAKRLKFEEDNDEDERTTKIKGGNIMLVEWDNSICTHGTTGAINTRLIDPIQFIPQEGIYKKKHMDYVFLTFEDTKARIKKRYGKDVSEEGIDPMSAESTMSNDTVTQVVCYFKNKYGGIGCYSWVGDTVLINDERYQARGKQICSKCGITKVPGEKKCKCGSKNFEKRNLDFEELTEDIAQFDGAVIPAMSYARDEGGNYALKDVEVHEMQTDDDPESSTYGMEFPAYREVLNELGEIVGDEPVMTTEPQAYEEPTKIPYYTPKGFPVCIRKNVSVSKRVLGSGDCELIYELQDKANKVATRLIEKCLDSGTILIKPKMLNFNFSNGKQVIDVDGPDQVSMITVKEIKYEIVQDINTVNQCYFWAKSLLGVNDSAQGKADATAVSGKAKEAQISRALGRQESKVIMKNTFYADIYRMIFEYNLAYADEPRKFKASNDEGEEVECIFNRYDFLEKDEFENWYYNDQFTFTVDMQGGIQENRQYVIDTIDKDLNSGLYGDPKDPETMLNVWKDREAMNYPNAKRQIARWQKKSEAAKAIQPLPLSPQIPGQSENILQGGEEENGMQTM